MESKTGPGAPVLDVVVRWHEAVIAVRRIEGTGAARVGSLPGSLAPIPCDGLPGGGFLFAEVARRTAAARVPAGASATVRRAGGGVEEVAGPAAVQLLAGDRVELALGAFTLSAAAEAPERRAPARPFAWAGGAWAHVAAVGLVHALVLGAGSRAALATELGGDSDDGVDVMRSLLVDAERRTRAEDPPLADDAGGGEGEQVNDREGNGRAGGGVAAAGAEGAAGAALARGGEARRYAVRQLAPRDGATELGVRSGRDLAALLGTGLLSQASESPTAAWGAMVAHGADALGADGALWARTLGESAGGGGLGLTGIGLGGGGSGEGAGVGRVGTVGHTDGPAGDGTGGDGSPVVLTGMSGGGSYSCGDVGVGVGVGHLTPGHRGGPVGLGRVVEGRDGRLPAEAIQRIVRQNFGRFRLCYEGGLRERPALAGRVAVRFLVGAGGGVSSAADAGSDLPDARVVSCVVRAFYGLSFPAPPGGVSVGVTYPILFSPDR